MERTLGRKAGNNPGRNPHREEPSEVAHVGVTALATADDCRRRRLLETPPRTLIRFTAARPQATTGPAMRGRVAVAGQRGRVGALRTRAIRVPWMRNRTAIRCPCP